MHLVTLKLCTILYQGGVEEDLRVVFRNLSKLRELPQSGSTLKHSLRLGLESGSPLLLPIADVASLRNTTHDDKSFVRDYKNFE